MTTKRWSIIAAMVGVMGVLGFMSSKMWQKPTEKAMAEKQAMPPVPGMPSSMPNQNGNVPPMPPEVMKLNEMQAEIAKLTDQQISDEMLGIKTKVAKMDGNKINEPAKFDTNMPPEKKDLLMRLALLRVERSKRDRAKPMAAEAGGQIPAAPQN